MTASSSAALPHLIGAGEHEAEELSPSRKYFAQSGLRQLTITKSQMEALIVAGAPADDAARRLADAYRTLNEARLLEMKGDGGSFDLSAQVCELAYESIDKHGLPTVRRVFGVRRRTYMSLFFSDRCCCHTVARKSATM